MEKHTAVQAEALPLGLGHQIGTSRVHPLDSVSSRGLSNYYPPPCLQYFMFLNSKHQEKMKAQTPKGILLVDIFFPKQKKALKKCFSWKPMESACLFFLFFLLIVKMIHGLYQCGEGQSNRLLWKITDCVCSHPHESASDSGAGNVLGESLLPAPCRHHF